MSLDICDILRRIHLVCPDDRFLLELESRTQLACPACGRRFAVHSNRCIELLPLKPAILSHNVSPEYLLEYHGEFAKRFKWDPAAVAWGAPEVMPMRWVRKRLRQVTMVFRIIRSLRPKHSGEVLCDVSAGAGYYTFEAARHFQYVVHCDLSVEGLNYAIRKADLLGLNNILFLRIDYFKPPFNRALDVILCLDTLIRGPSHEIMLLTALRRSLNPTGTAIVDFHNWWHNPLRRLGFLPQNFGNNVSYSRRVAEAIIREAGFSTWEYFPFCQEVEADKWYGLLISRVMPPTRFVYACRVE